MSFQKEEMKLFFHEKVLPAACVNTQLLTLFNGVISVSLVV